MAAAQPRAINRERIEEQRRQALAPPDIEEVVRSCSGCEVAGQLARQGSEDQRSIEMACMIGHHDERSVEAFEVFLA